MKENTNNNSEKINVSANQTDANVDTNNSDLSADADVMAMAKQYKREDSQRKVALHGITDGEYHVSSHWPMLFYVMTRQVDYLVVS